MKLTGSLNFLTGLIVRENIILKKFWRQTLEVQETMLVELCALLNPIFDVNVRVVRSGSPEHYAMTGGGNLNFEDRGLIEMSPNRSGKLSLLTFLFCYGLALNEKGWLFAPEEAEVMPINWAHTIFCLSSRSEYLKSRSGGKFFHSNVELLAPIGAESGSFPTDEEINQRYDEALAAAVAKQANSNFVEVAAEVDYE